ncbi:thioesterase [Streptomyces spinoverrucosus]|uniref:thioesterase family protein n=1 Tax=Streptomyces spinoverrucosus TaxID=284043 RepID=UPI0018C39078|nr:thioesterase [Streptomyces spinoverrucosus]MBG0850444.1 thioesterase [Streptomyces spinoverrucosus]
MRHEVTEADTAVRVGSGDVPVLATPRLIEWLEAATTRAARPLVATGLTTVGTAVRVRHLRATGVGGVVEVSAQGPAGPAARRLTFKVQAVDGAGELVATGEIDRAIVDRDRFVAAVSGKTTDR